MKAPKRLTKKEIATQLKRHSLDWTLSPKATQLSKQFRFTTYLDAFMFVARISVHAEVLKHHPELTLSYGKVKVKVTTHEAKGVTKRDFDLIKRIEEVFTRLGNSGKKR